MSVLLKDPAFALVFVCFVLSVAHFISGSFRAWLNGVFEITALKVWVSKDGNSLVPIVLWIALSKILGIVDLAQIAKAFGVDIGEAGGVAGLGSMALAGYAGIAAFSYIVSTLGDIKANLAPDPAGWQAKVAKAISIGDPIPGTTPKVE